MDGLVLPSERRNASAGLPVFNRLLVIIKSKPAMPTIRTIGQLDVSMTTIMMEQPHLTLIVNARVKARSTKPLTVDLPFDIFPECDCSKAVNLIVYVGKNVSTKST